MPGGVPQLGEVSAGGGWEGMTDRDYIPLLFFQPQRDQPRRSLEQRHLRICLQPQNSPLAISQAMLPAELRHELRNTLVVRLGEKCMLRITFFVVFM